MGTRYLLDTNTAIYFLNGQLTPNGFAFVLSVMNVECNLSVISKMELLGWSTTDPNDEIKIRSFINDSAIFSLTDEIVEKTIELRRLYKTKLPDAIIAATAIVYGFTLISRNDKDFTRVAELNYFNPFTL